MNPLIKIFDDITEIIYTGTFNIYNNKLIIDGLLDKKFIFIFEKKEPEIDQKDIVSTWVEENSECHIVVSKKFRNSTGAGTTNKIKIIKTAEGDDYSFSLFGHQWGEESLSITLAIYLDKKI